MVTVRAAAVLITDMNINLMNQARAYRFLLGVLTSQQKEPFCGQCSAWNNSLNNSREGLARFVAEHASELSALPEAGRILAETRAALAALAGPAEPAGQKKAGNCKLPEGVCFVKASLALLQKV